MTEPLFLGVMTMVQLIVEARTSATGTSSRTHKNQTKVRR